MIVTTPIDIEALCLKKGGSVCFAANGMSKYNAILGGPLFQGFRVPLPAYASLESYVRSRVPGVNLPVPISPPSLPFGLPRFF
jgi:hypothetical protein